MKPINGYPLFHASFRKIFLICLVSLLFSFHLSAQLPVKQWDVRFGGTSADYLQSIQQTTDGGYILGGYSSGTGGDKSQPSQGESDMWIVKINGAGAKQWDKRFGGSEADYLYDVQQTPDGGYILGGYSLSGISGDKSEANHGGSDFWIVKTNASGVKQWDKTFGGDFNETLTSLQLTSDGGYIFAGYTNSPVSGDVSADKLGKNDYWVLKIDASGTKQWDARFGGSQDELLQAIEKTSDGGYILGGFSASNSSGDKSQDNHGYNDYWVVKINATGDKQWEKAFGGTGDDYLHDLQQTSDGGYILGGNSSSSSSGDKTAGSNGSDDFWIVKTDANGNKQWDKTFGGNQSDGFQSLQQAADGGYILAGSSAAPISGDKTQSTQGNFDFWMVKTDGNGQWKFDRRYGSTGYEFANIIRQTADGGFVIGGTSDGVISGDKTQTSQGANDYWVVKTTPSGAVKNIYPGTITPMGYMQGNSISIPYTVSGTFNPGNIFKAQLSDGAGNFESGIYIGIVSSTTSGTIAATIPPNLPNGTGYRIRVISSSPPVSSIANTDNITVGIYPVKQWDYRFGSTSHDWFECMQPTSDGGYILGGYDYAAISGDKTDPGNGTDDYWVVKTNANGIKQWDADFGGSGYDRMHALCQGADGGYLVAGETNSGISGDVSQASKGGSDYWVVKTNANGVKQWDKRFGSSDNDNLEAVLQTSDGGYILGGYTQGNFGDKSQISKGQNDFWIVKIDANGIKQWDKDFGGTLDDNLFSMQQTADGGYIFGGISVSGIGGDKTQPNKGDWDYWIVKTDANGIKQWDASFGGSDSDYFSSVRQTSDGGYIVSGSSYSGMDGDKSEPGRGGTDYWMVKTDANGVKQWDKRFGGDDQEYVGSAVQTNDGGYILSGSSQSGLVGDITQTGKGSHDYWIVKTDASGTKTWDARFGGSGFDDALIISQTADGGYAIGGTSSSQISGDKSQEPWGGGTSDYWLVKIDGGSIPGTIITNLITPLHYLQGDAVTVPYSASGIFTAGNIFTAQLSDAFGNFSASNPIGAVTSTTSGTINATIPLNTVNGTNYRIRVVSSTPFMTGNDNGQGISIGCMTPTGFSAINLNSSSETLSWNAVTGAEKYKLRYKVTGTNIWTTSTTTAISKTITGLLNNTSYTWQVQTICQSVPAITSEWSPQQSFSTSLRVGTGELLSQFEIFPNPISSSATITFTLTQTSNLKIELFDLTGKKIKTIAEENFEAGNHKLNFSTSELPAGIYVIQLTSSDQIFIHKIIKQ